jgi:GyrI-like small molecule binding domain
MLYCMVPPSRRPAHGALYPGEWFQQEAGELVAFVPVPAGIRGSGRVQVTDIPAAELAIAVHHGALADLDQTYAALGTYVAERQIGVDGPIRELYLCTPFDTPDETLHVTESAGRSSGQRRIYSGDTHDIYPCRQ